MSTIASEPVSSQSFVTLNGGLIVRVEAIRLLLALEARGVTLSADQGDILLHAPALVTDEDRAALRRFKPHVLALLAYSERVQ